MTTPYGKLIVGTRVPQLPHPFPIADWRDHWSKGAIQGLDVCRMKIDWNSAEDGNEALEQQRRLKETLQDKLFVPLLQIIAIVECTLDQHMVFCFRDDTMVHFLFKKRARLGIYGMVIPNRHTTQWPNLCPGGPLACVSAASFVGTPTFVVAARMRTWLQRTNLIVLGGKTVSPVCVVPNWP
jgi:hypothetical protein